jgi:hypothetical protein
VHASGLVQWFQSLLPPVSAAVANSEPSTHIAPAGARLK